MFYHPHFCCHCGEKIIRANWTPLTSRRFCDFCSIEQKQHDLIPRAAALLLILFGAAGFTAYLTTGRGTSAPERSAVSAKFRDPKADKTQGSSGTRGADPARANDTQVENTAAPPTSRAENANSKQRETLRNSSTEAVYYCGALTKKGTACTRRVKAPGRCWQHLGQPAVSSPPN